MVDARVPRRQLPDLRQPGVGRSAPTGRGQIWRPVIRPSRRAAAYRFMISGIGRLLCTVTVPERHRYGAIMSDASDLYAAILADPDDMTLRLRYADTVNATDPDHAELIRLQIEYDRTNLTDHRLPDPEIGRMERLRLRLTPLLGAPLAPLVGAWEVRRGFAELIELPGADFLRHGPEIYRRAPVRHALLTDVDTALVPALAASPLLARLSSLSLSHNPIGDDGIRALLGSPYLTKIRWLGLMNCDIGPVGVDAFASAVPHVMPNLRFLRFGRNRADLVPYGMGSDAVSGQDPIEVHVPGIADRIAAEHGPLPWLDPAWAWRGGFVDVSQV